MYSKIRINIKLNITIPEITTTNNKETGMTIFQGKPGLFWLRELL